MYNVHVHSRICGSNFCVDNTEYFIIFRYLLPKFPAVLDGVISQNSKTLAYQSIKKIHRISLNTVRHSQSNLKIETTVS